MLPASFTFPADKVPFTGGERREFRSGGDKGKRRVTGPKGARDEQPRGDRGDIHAVALPPPARMRPCN